jgi:hypothetical protein
LGAYANRMLEREAMFNTENFYNARWQDLYQFFAAGEPPLMLKLLAINTLFFVIYIMRRAKGRQSMRANTAYMVQGVLIAVNICLMFAPNILHVDKLARFAV